MCRLAGEPLRPGVIILFPAIFWWPTVRRASRATHRHLTMLYGNAWTTRPPNLGSHGQGRIRGRHQRQTTRPVQGGTWGERQSSYAFGTTDLEIIRLMRRAEFVRDTYMGKHTLMELRRYLEEYRPKAASIEQLIIDQDGGPLTPHAIQWVLGRLKKKLGLKHLGAHQFPRTWATNFRKKGVSDLFDLQQEGGWEDLEVPQRFYVDVDGARPGIRHGPLGDQATQAEPGDSGSRSCTGSTGSRTSRIGPRADPGLTRQERKPGV